MISGLNGDTPLCHLCSMQMTILLAPSPTGLQKLLDIYYEYACMFELKYNIKKTECMLRRPKWLKSLKTPSLL